MFISQLGLPKPFTSNFANSKPLLYDIILQAFFFALSDGKIMECYFITTWKYSHT